MSLFRMHLWKEWREQCAAVRAIAWILLLGVGGTLLSYPRLTMGSLGAFGAVVVLPVLAVAAVVGSDLLGRERARGGLELLARLPLGLETAFRAKLALYLVLLAAAVVFGALLGWACTWLEPWLLVEAILALANPLALGALTAVVLWTFAASAWAPTSTLALPAAVLLLGTLSWPAVVILRLQGQQAHPALVACLSIVILAAPLGARASFATGSGRLRSRRRATLAGVGIAALAFSPSWVWAGVQWTAPGRAPFMIAGIHHGPDPRLLFITLCRMPPPGAEDEASSRFTSRRTAVIADIEDGSHRLAGPVDASTFLPVHPPGRRRHSHVRLKGPAGETLLHTDSGAPCGGCVDAETHAFPSGAHTDLPAGISHLRPMGLGFAGFRRGESDPVLYLDPQTSVTVESGELPEGTAKYLVFIRPGRWIVRKDATGYLWFDPVTRETEPLTLEAGATLGPIVSDGTLVLLSGGRLWVLDPETGARRPIQVEFGGQMKGIARGITGAGSYFPADEPVFVPAGEAAFVSVYGSRDPADAGARSLPTLGRLDLAAGVLRPVVPFGDESHPFVLHADSSRILVQEARWNGGKTQAYPDLSIVLYDTARGTREVVFEASRLQ